MCVRRNSEALSCNHCFREKQYLLHIYFECVPAASVIQRAKRLLHIIFSSVACPALPYISTLSNKMHYFRGKKLLNVRCVL